MEMNSSAPRPAQNRVRETREELLLTRDDLARRAGVSLRTVWSVEAGHDCRVETKRAILRALGVSRSRYREIFPLPVRAFAAPAHETTSSTQSGAALV